MFRPRSSNYTPADLISRWALDTDTPYAYNRHGRIYVDYDGHPFAFDRWTIIPIDETTEQIDITLTQLGAWPLT